MSLPATALALLIATGSPVAPPPDDAPRAASEATQAVPLGIATAGGAMVVAGAALWGWGTFELRNVPSSGSDVRDSLSLQRRAALQKVVGGAALAAMGVCTIGMAVVLAKPVLNHAPRLTVGLGASPNGLLIALAGPFP